MNEKRVEKRLFSRSISCKINAYITRLSSKKLANGKILFDLVSEFRPLKNKDSENKLEIITSTNVTKQRTN